MKNNKGFTLIELIVTIAIISVLSGIILFTTSQYINKGKDSNIASNLAVLIPAGETFYNNASNKYTGFCDTESSSVLAYNISQMPVNSSGDCATNNAGVCCSVAEDGQSWSACAQEFSDPTKAYCADSRGVKEEICNSFCTSNLTQCPDASTQTNCSS